MNGETRLHESNLSQVQAAESNVMKGKLIEKQYD